MKNAAIDLATDKIAKGIGAKVGSAAAKAGLTKSNIVKGTKSALTSSGVNITRNTNNAVKSTAGKIINGVKSGAKNATMAGTKGTVENVKDKTNQ